MDVVMAVKPKMLAIIGPTASGKSQLAMALARRAGAQILSVDSMQVYRGMDIGTAKPDATERAEVRHHLIDVVDPNESFTVARFLQLADAVIGQSTAALIAAGGTPLYFKSLFQGIFEGPGADADLRARLSLIENDELHRRLGEVDPAAAVRIHANDSRRMIRALEVYELTGKPISEIQTEWSAAKGRHDALWIGVNWEKAALNRRINARVKTMIEQGWLEETRSLLDRFGSLSKTAAEATGYHELIEHLHGHLTLDEAIEQIKIATRQLARRQMKWFRRFPNVMWLAGEMPLEAQVSALDTLL